MNRRRVVITGIGTVNCLGNNLNDSWKRLLQAESGITSISRFDASSLKTQIAGEVRNFNPSLYMSSGEAKRYDLFIQYSLAATKMAFEQAGVSPDDFKSESVGCLLGVGRGGYNFTYNEIQNMLTNPEHRVSPFYIVGSAGNMASAITSIYFQLRGPSYTVNSACSSSLNAMGDAFRMIRDGYIDAVVAGGSESAIGAGGIRAFSAMKVLSTSNEVPGKASRPFDQNRDGFVLSEGSAVFFMESLERAQKRNAQILCEITGYGFSNDAVHLSHPHPDGDGVARSMAMALSDANLKLEDISYINAHATATKVGDEGEKKAIERLFENESQKTIVISNKGFIGHSLGACGAVESAFVIQSIQDQLIPPNANLENPMPTNLKLITETTEARVRHVLKNNSAFGGNNASMIFSEFRS